MVLTRAQAKRIGLTPSMVIHHATESTEHSSPRKRAATRNRTTTPVTPTRRVQKRNQEALSRRAKGKDKAEQFAAPSGAEQFGLSRDNLRNQFVQSGPTSSSFDSNILRLHPARTILSEEATARIRAQQQASMAQRADDAYREQSRIMMEQRNLAYQWYDRMMTEGLQNGQGSAPTTVVVGGILVPGLGNNSTIQSSIQEQDDDAERMTEVDDEEGQTEKEMIVDTESSYHQEGGRTEAAYFEDPTHTAFSRIQYQPCAPGVEYSSFSDSTPTPTEILEDWD